MKRFISLVLILGCVVSLAACAGSGKRSYDLVSADRARAFYNTYNRYVEEYGEAKETGGVLYGVSVVRLYDFTGDSAPEMLLAYSSEKNGKTDSLMVCSFDMGFAEIYNDKITSKSDSGAEVNCLWVYTDSSELSYIVMGDDLSSSRSYLTYQQADAEGNPIYKFAEAFTTDGEDLSGTYEKINLTGNTDSEGIFSENLNVIEALESQKN